MESILVDKKVQQKKQDKFIDYGSIYGGAPFFYRTQRNQHFTRISGKGRFVFSVGAFDEYVKAAEVGLMADLFIKKYRLW